MSRSIEKKQAKQMKAERLYTLFIIVLALVVISLCFLFFLRSCGRLSAKTEGLFSAAHVEAVRFVNDAHDFSFRRSADIWRNEEDETFPVDQDRTNALLDFMGALTPTRTLSGEMASKYELTQPLAKLTITLDDGTENILSIGGLDEKTGERYFTFTGRNGLLTTAQDLNSFGTISEYDLIAVPQPPFISNRDVTGVHIVNHALDTEVVLDRYTEFRPDIDLSGTCTWFSTLSDGLERPANEDNIPYLLAAIESIRYEYCVGWNASDAFLTACGFDDPEVEMTIRWTGEGDQTLSLILSGSTQGGAHYFAREQGQRNVYLIPAPVGMFFESATPDNMTSKNPGYVGMSSLAAFRADLGDETISGAIDRSNDAVRYTVNGVETSQYDFTMLYASFFDLYGSVIVPVPPAERGKTVFSLILDLEGHETLDQLVYELSEYDEAHYAFSTNGRIWMLVKKSKFSELRSALDEHLKQCLSD